MATVDKLQIEIGASTYKAEKAIDSLIGKLGTLSRSLDSVDANKLNSSTAKMSETFGKCSIKISNIGNKTKNMARSFSSASGSITKSHLSIKNITKSLMGLEKATNKTNGTLDKLASTLGGLYAKLWIFKRGIGSLWKAISSSMDYIETLNYFNASFGQVADSAVSNFREAGYDSAQAYYDSFAERASELTKKLSGFALGADGNLKGTEAKSLGLDPEMTMASQAQFAQMASSMGVASETAMKLSEALTKIGADLASVKNMNFADVWDDMASGMVGMSRTLDKYGVNIRNANLQTKLTELGINATVSSLSQADKALLRTIILLDSTKYAWGDLATTINAPSNQLRLLTSNLHNCARMLGNIFLPIVAKVLPVVNALVIAIQRLLSAIASFLGIDLSGVFATSGSGSGNNSALSDILDESDELGDSLDEDSKSAKKLKQNLMGVDELNIVSDSDSGSGSSSALGGLGGLLDDAFMDALMDYENAWNEAFDAMTNKANEMADKIVEFAKKVFSPIAEAWGNTGAEVVDAWKKAFKSLGELIKDVGRDAMAVWLQPETVKIWEDIFNIIKDVGLIVDSLAQNLRTAWNYNDTGLLTLENIRNTFLGIADTALDVFDYAVKIAETINFIPLLTSIENLTRAIGDNSHNIFGILGDIVKRFIDFGQYLVEEFFPQLNNHLANMIGRIDWDSLRGNLATISTAIERLAEVIGGALLKVVEKLTDAVVKFVNGNFFKNLAKDFDELATKLEKAKSLGQVIDAIFDFNDGRVKDIVTLFNSAVDAIQGFLDKLNSIDPNTGKRPIAQIGERIAESINTAISNWDAGATGSLVSDLAHTALQLINKVIEQIDWFTVGKKIGDFLREIDWMKLSLDLLEILGNTIGGLMQTKLGMYLKAPFETALLDVVTRISLLSFGVKLVSKIGEAVTGKSVISQLGKSFGTLFSKAVESGTTEASTVLSKTASSGAKGGTFAKLGSIVGSGIAIASAVEFGEKIGNEINKAFGQEEFHFTFDNAKEIFDSMFDQFDILANDDIPWYKQFGEYFVTGLGGGITGALTFLGSPIKALFDYIWNGIKSIFGIASPAKAMYPLGEFILLGVLEGFRTKIAEFGVAVGEFFGKFGEWFGQVKEKLDEHVGTPFRTFFTETLPQHMDSFATKIGEWKDGVVQKFQEWKDGVVGKIGEWATETWESISQWATDTYTDVSNWVADTVKAIGDWYDTTKRDITTWVADTVGDFKQWYTDATNAIKDWFSETKQKFVDWEENTIRSVEEWYTNTKEKIGKWVGEVKTDFETWRTNVKGTIDGWVGETKRSFETWKSDVEGTVSRWTSKVKTDFETWRTETGRKFEEWSGNVKTTFENWKTNVIGKVENFSTNTKTTINNWREKITSKIEEFKTDSSTAIEKFKEKGEGFIKNFKENSLPHIESFAQKAISTIKGWKTDTLDQIEKTKTDGLDKIEKFVNGAKEWFSERNWSFSGIREGLGNALDSALDWARQKWRGIQDWFGGLNLDFNLDFGGGSRYSYSGYASGGFPEDGWFRASHGELIGKFDNGQTVVANNNQIIEGIQGGVERAVSSVLAPYLADIADNTRRTANKNTSINIDGREIVSAYDSRKTRNGYAF